MTSAVDAIMSTEKRPKHRWEDNIEIDIKYLGCIIVDGAELDRGFKNDPASFI